MIDKLRSHLETRRSEKGFTLIELLVVIAIIAILVLIVLIAINPAEQIKKANDRKWESLMNQTASGVHICITQELAAGVAAATVISTGAGGCGANGAPLKPTYIGANVDISKVVWGATAGTAICGSIDVGANGGHTGYTSFDTSSGAVKGYATGAVAASPCP